MSLSVLEVLQNAQINLDNPKFEFQVVLAKEQLSNAIEQLKTDSDANKTYIEGTEDGE